MDSPKRGFVENSVAKALVMLAALAAAFLATTPLTQTGVFRSDSVPQKFLEFPVGSPIGLLVGFPSRSVTLAALAGWIVYVVLAVAVVWTHRPGRVTAGLLLLAAMLVLNVLIVWMVAALSGLR
jgi:hypothetical protein